LTGYLKIIRIPNLLIIILTQYLLRICVIGTFYGLNATSPALSQFDFALLVLSTLLIAAGGYVINDYNDIEVDKINKPGKVIIGKSLSSNSSFLYYWILTMAGVVIGFYLSFTVQYFMLGFIFVAIAMMLWFYSAQYKKTAFWGNFVIALLSAMVVLIVWLFEFFALRANPINYTEAMKQLELIGSIVAAYAVFAFLVSLIRELVKDIEDMEGDKASGYKTLPVWAGINPTKSVAAIVTCFTILLLALSQFYLYKMNLMFVFWYLLIAVQSLLFFQLYNLIKAKKKEDYHFLSNTAKIIMVAGILSMQLFYIRY
jgi:4-hydroxybenzoate polyprenyltransferase